MRAALKALSDHPEVTIDLSRDVASLYETSPVGGPDGQSSYFNSVVRIVTNLSPISLLDVLLSKEDDLGRIREVHWGPRNIDLDLLLYDDVVLQTDRLTLPHPRLHQRRFVLEPLYELAPQLMHPQLHRTMADLVQAAVEFEKGDQVNAVMPPDWPQ
jgi:2-amino-4-hydroxy-6-hydroxymethyldihydropteridine diphosphokinase